MKLNFVVLSVLVLAMAGFSLAQQPGPPPPGPRQGQEKPDWAKAADTDKNGSVDATEFQAAIDRTFAGLDKNGNGVIDPGEAHFPPPKGDNGQPQGRQGGGQPGMNPRQRQGQPLGQGGGQPGAR